MRAADNQVRAVDRQGATRADAGGRRLAVPASRLLDLAFFRWTRLGGSNDDRGANDFPATRSPPHRARLALRPPAIASSVPPFPEGAPPLVFLDRFRLGP